MFQLNRSENTRGASDNQGMLVLGEFWNRVIAKTQSQRIYIRKFHFLSTQRFQYQFILTTKDYKTLPKLMPSKLLEL